MVVELLGRMRGNMTAKEYLEQSRKIRQEIVWINKQIEEIETSLGYHPMQLDDSGASKSNFVPDKMCEALSKVGDLYTDLNEKKAELVIKNNEIYSRLELLEDVSEREVLRLRYLERHPLRPLYPIGWVLIARKMNYSKQGIIKLHSRALKHFGEVLKRV